MWSRIKNFFERLSRQRRKKEIYRLENEFKENLLDLGRRFNDFDPIKEEERFKKHWTQIIKQDEKKMKKKV